MQKSMRERNYQTYRLLLLTDVIHYLVIICCLPENTPASQALQLSIEAHIDTPLACRVVREEIGCNKWKKTLAYLLVLPGSRARIVRCGGRYDHQLVKRSSE